MPNDRQNAELSKRTNDRDPSYLTEFWKQTEEGLRFSPHRRRRAAIPRGPWCPAGEMQVNPNPKAHRIRDPRTTNGNSGDGLSQLSQGEPRGVTPPAAGAGTWALTCQHTCPSSHSGPTQPFYPHPRPLGPEGRSQRPVSRETHGGAPPRARLPDCRRGARPRVARAPEEPETGRQHSVTAGVCSAGAASGAPAPARPPG